MGRTTMRVRETETREKQSPIWRGIGCLLIIIIPVVSYTAAVISMPFFLERGLVPKDLLFKPEMPSWVWYAPVLAQAFRFLFIRYGIYALLLLTLLYILFLGGVFSVFYAFIYRIIGPQRYGPLDAPPPRKKIKKYTR